MAVSRILLFRLFVCAALSCVATAPIAMAVDDWNPVCWVGGCKPFTTTNFPNLVKQYHCNTISVDGSFLQQPYRYRVTGACRLLARDMNSTTFDNDKLLSTTQWSADGTFHDTRHEANEVLSLNQEITGRKGFVTSGRITSFRVCAKDPWRESEGVSCGSARIDRSGSIDQDMDSSYRASPVPVSATIGNDRRAALRQQLARTLQELQNMSTTAKSLGGLSPAQKAALARTTQAGPSVALGPLVVTEPVQNSRVVQGKFRVKVTPPAGFTDINSASVALEFTWLDTPANYTPRPFVNTFPVGLTALIGGYTVPQGVTRGQTGRWQVRARITSPLNGVWSAAVPFILALQ